MKLNFKKIIKDSYYLGILCLCLKYFTMRLTFISFNDSFLGIIILAAFSLKILLQKNRLHEWIWIVGLIIFSGLVIWKTGDNNFLYTIMAICASKHMDLKRVVRYIFKINVMVLSFIVIAYGFNLFFDVVPLMHRMDGSVRYTFYFNHSNTFAGTAFWTIAQYVYLNFHKLTLKNYFICAFILILVFFLTDSRTTLMLSIIFFLLLILIKKYNLKKQILFVSKFIFVICAIAMLSLSLLYGLNKTNSIMLKIDSLTSRRVSLLEKALDVYGFTILPSKVNLTKIYKWDSGNYGYLYLDSLYSRGYVVNGILYLILIAYLIYQTSKLTKQEEQLFFIIFSILATMERYAFYPSVGFVILYFSKYIFRKNKAYKKRKKFRHSLSLPFNEEKI